MVVTGVMADIAMGGVIGIPFIYDCLEATWSDRSIVSTNVDSTLY